MDPGRGPHQRWPGNVQCAAITVSNRRVLSTTSGQDRAQIGNRSHCASATQPEARGNMNGESIADKAYGVTYCVGVMLDKGMIFASDSRTNAGVDNFAKFCKMTVFERRGNRVIVLLSSGNLAGTQAVISVLTQRCADGDAATNVLGARTMFDVVTLVSDANARYRETRRRVPGGEQHPLQCLVHRRWADRR